MKKSELKQLIQETIQEVVWGSTTKQIFSDAEGKTVKEIIEHPDKRVTVKFTDGSSMDFDRYSAYKPAPPSQSVS